MRTFIIIAAFILGSFMALGGWLTVELINAVGACP